ncbi:MAG: class I SAM-dependent methyltransferase [bacterium]|nr:MAG: class I SAM-dependent methyltransferase [bacterium]
MKGKALVIPEDIPSEQTPDLLRHWYLGSLARRYLSVRRFETVTSLVGTGDGKRALDVGCGWGYNLHLLHEAGFDPYGIDIVQNDFFAARRIGEANGYPVTLVGADISRLPFADGTFAAVTAVETFEHIFEPDRPRAAREIARVLAPGGTFVLSTPNYGSLVERGKRMIVRLPVLKSLFPTMCYPVGDVLRNDYHPYSYHKPLHPQELTALLTAAGLRVFSMDAILFITKNVSDRFFQVTRALESVMESLPPIRALASTLIVSAGKDR